LGTYFLPFLMSLIGVCIEQTQWNDIISFLVCFP
jgi:hypothetical protein